ncbi:hypothetical protein V495_00167 [Pseudogymnoascus sp. VKM F-4514 (FW-929)]|nr:hypothetical protein V495_00167 [Pseudogymnoascus sp. VKM F-4514 (FW-929)]
MSSILTLSPSLIYTLRTASLYNSSHISKSSSLSRLPNVLVPLTQSLPSRSAPLALRPWTPGGVDAGLGYFRIPTPVSSLLPHGWESSRRGSHFALSNRRWNRDSDIRTTTTMKKRAAESDVRAMAAALGVRQGGPLKNPPAGSNLDSSLDIRLTLVNSDGSEFTGNLYKGVVLTAQITKTSGDANTLYIGAVELVNQNAPTDIHQIFTNTTCFDVLAKDDFCALTPKPFEGEVINLPLDPITSITPGNTYSINLRYSEEAAGSKAEDLSTLSAKSSLGQERSFQVSSDASSTSGGAPPPAKGTGTSSVVVPNAATSNAGPAKPSDASSTSGGAPPPAKGTGTSSVVASNAATTNAGPAKPTLSDSPDSPASAPSTTATSVPTGNAPTVAPDSSSSHGLSTGAKAGIGVGVAAAVLIVIALIVAWWVRRQRRASARNGRTGTGEKESVLAAAAPGGSGEYRDADEAGGAVVGSSPVTRKPVGMPAASTEAALADAVSPASTTVGVVRGPSRAGAGEGSGAVQESMLNAEERERWEEEERRLDEDIAEAERRRLGA